jgi:rubredoxin
VGERFFDCEVCGRRFRATSSEEETLAEMRQRFGEIPEDEQASICDDCEVEYMNRVLSWT